MLNLYITNSNNNCLNSYGVNQSANTTAHLSKVGVYSIQKQLLPKQFKKEEATPVPTRPHAADLNVYSDCPPGIVRPNNRGFTQLVIYVINYKLKSLDESQKANLQVPQIVQTTSLTRRQPVTWSSNNIHTTMKSNPRHPYWPGKLRSLLKHTHVYMRTVK